MDYKATEEGLAHQSWSKDLRKALEAAESPDGKPSWWYKRQDNTAGSHLYQLPDELLLGICRHLEGSDVYIARQTCFLLRRVLSDEEFVSPARGLQALLRLPATPERGVDWEDVHERLRRRGCCSACSDARMPKEDGGDSDFDTTLQPLVNETQYCLACNDWHPRIMFSHTQRRSTSPPFLARGKACPAEARSCRCRCLTGVPSFRTNTTFGGSS